MHMLRRHFVLRQLSFSSLGMFDEGELSLCFRLDYKLSLASQRQVLERQIYDYFIDSSTKRQINIADRMRKEVGLLTFLFSFGLILHRYSLIWDQVDRMYLIVQFFIVLSH
jgi:hypothetical protein